jgi:hypothetical protein
MTFQNKVWKVLAALFTIVSLANTEPTARVSTLLYLSNLCGRYLYIACCGRTLDIPSSKHLSSIQQSVLIPGCATALFPFDPAHVTELESAAASKFIRIISIGSGNVPLLEDLRDVVTASA